MKKYIILTLLLCSFITKAQIIQLSMPIDRAVYQRNGNTNASSAIVDIMGQVPTQWQSSWVLQYRVVKLSKTGEEGADYVPWTNIATPTLGKIFHVKRSFPTGWYKLYIQLLQSGVQISLFNRKFGVGEVFVIAGQSNATGEGPVTYASSFNKGQDYDCIIASAQSNSNKCSGNLPVYPVFTALNKNTSYISPNGVQPWAYNMLATKIIDSNTSTVIPVMFFNAGLSGSSSSDWNVTANDPTQSRSTNYGNDRCTQESGNGFSKGEPFRSLRNVLNYYGSLLGVRGVIWHQGESDNTTGQVTSIADYTANLNNVIQKSRDNFNANLPWAISKVSWNGTTTNSQITTGQDNARTAKSGANGAIGSDLFFTATHRQYPGDGDGLKVHFNIKGLDALSTNYKDNIATLLAKTPVLGNRIVPVTFTQSGSSKIVTLNFASIGKTASNFNCFFWTQGDNYTAITYPSYGCSSSDTYTKTFISNGSWRCYMRENGTGNVYMTQKLTINTASSVRIAASSLNSSVFPNPTYLGFENTISFAVNENEFVKLELLNEQGELLETLAESVHAAGQYQYPFTLKSKQLLSSIETVYYRLTIGDQTETKRIIID